MPGHHADAVRVVNGEFEALEADCISDDEPSGSARTVYRVGDVVYKVEGCRKNDNKTEAEIFYHFRNEPWASPVTLYKVGEEKVLCMPFYDYGVSWLEYGVVERIEDQLEKWARDHGKIGPTGDLHSGNYRILPDGQVKVIDAAGNFNM